MKEIDLYGTSWQNILPVAECLYARKKKPSPAEISDSLLELGERRAEQARKKEFEGNGLGAFCKWRAAAQCLLFAALECPDNPKEVAHLHELAFQFYRRALVALPSEFLQEERMEILYYGVAEEAKRAGQNTRKLAIWKKRRKCTSSHCKPILAASPL